MSNSQSDEDHTETPWVKTGKELLVAIPVAHIIFSATYLLGYEYAFGKAISSFSSPTDIFSVSLKEVGRTYFFMIAILAVGTVYFRAKYGFYTKADYVGSLEGDEHEKALTKFISDRNFYKWLAIVMMVMGFIASLFSWYVNRLFPYDALFLPTTIAALLSLIWAANRIGWGRLEFFILIVVLLLFLNCLFRGLINGQNDRYAMFAAKVSESPTCGQFAVLRPMGDNFLALRADNRAAMIDSECKQKFELPRTVKPQQRKLLGLPVGS